MLPRGMHCPHVPQSRCLLIDHLGDTAMPFTPRVRAGAEAGPPPSARTLGQRNPFRGHAEGKDRANRGIDIIKEHRFPDSPQWERATSKTKHIWQGPQTKG